MAWCGAVFAFSHECAPSVRTGRCHYSFRIKNYSLSLPHIHTRVYINSPQPSP